MGGGGGPLLGHFTRLLRERAPFPPKVESRRGVTAHGSPSGPLQFNRLGSHPGRQNSGMLHSVERFVETQHGDREQADPQAGHSEHLRPEDLHPHTFQIRAPQHDQKIA